MNDSANDDDDLITEKITYSNYKSAAEIFYPVDPALTVIPRRKKHHDDMMRDEANWGKARGARCSQCNHEALRFNKGPHGYLCDDCVQIQIHRREKSLERKALIQYFKKYKQLPKT